MADKGEEIRTGADEASASEMLARLPAPVARALGELRVPLTVVLGETKLPLQELLELQAGRVVELQQRVGEPVRVIVAGHEVARGELVQIEGRLAVRLVEVGPEGSEADNG